MILSSIVVILLVLSAAADLTCEPGWNAYAPTQCCYKAVNKERISFDDADKKCQEEDGRLVSIHSRVENDEVHRLFTSKFGRSTHGIWIGSRSLQPKMHTYEWMDGSPNDYTNWAPNEPNNWNSLAEDCISLYLQENHPNALRKWNDRPCKVDRYNIAGYVCKKCPRSDECPAESIGFREYCYLPVKTKLMFDAAEKYCAAKGGHLTSILDGDERRFVAALVKTLAKGTSVRGWTGLSATMPGRVFAWTDGTRIEKDNTITKSVLFATNRERMCVYMRQDGKMFTNDCTRTKRPFICKKTKDMKHYHALVKELRTQLFSNYSRRVIPTKTRNKPKKIQLMLGVTKLVEVNDERSTVAVQGNLRVMWKDEYLAWNATNGRYKGINEIYIRRWRIWRPYVTADNNIGASYPFNIMPLKLGSNGLITQWYRSSINISCHMDVYNYPFDKQSCEIWIGVGQYRTTDVIISSAFAGLIYTFGRKMPAVNGWKLASVTGTENYVYYSPESGSMVLHRKLLPRIDGERPKHCFGSFLVAKIRLKRYNPYFINTMLIPAICATSLNLVSFIISSFELSIGILLINFILQTIFTLDAAFSIPQTIVMDVVPPLLCYYGFNLIVTVLTFLLFIFVYYSTGFIQTRLAEWSTINSVGSSRVLTKVLDLLPRDNIRLELLSEDYENRPTAAGGRDNQAQILLHRLKMIGLLVSLIVHFVTAIWLMF